ncbi:MAG TPA: GGDEF domain-containing protein [Lachnospiraceae bacterium]|nr:GGDEF domain-containing protein [Lachnospiraceae bacterium]
MDKRINVGLFVSNLDNAFDNAVYCGAAQGAKETDVNLLVFPGRYLKGQYNDLARSRCEYQYNTVFSYANKENIDVLLVILGTIGTVLSERERKTFLKMFSDIPIILIADEIEGYPSITFDNTSGLRDGIEDLIVNKQRKAIGMVSGPVTNEDAMERLQVYKETLKEHGMEVKEERIVYGNFSEFSEGVVEKLLDDNPDLDAIVFGNDQMAVGGYNVLKERSIVIGQDIAVMGFDDAPVASMMVPNLTTVRADAVELGRRAVIESFSYIKTGVFNKEPVKTSLVRRRSSGNEENIMLDGYRKENFEKQLAIDTRRAAGILVNHVFGEKCTNKEYGFFVECMTSFVEEFLGQMKDESKRMTIERAGYLIDHALSSASGENFEIRQVFQLFELLKCVVKEYMSDKQQDAADLLYSYLIQVTMVVTTMRQKSETELGDLLWMSNSIARDMLIFGDCNDQSYKSVIDKLIRLGFSSAFLYSLESPFINLDTLAWHDWQIPRRALLKSYFNNKNDIQSVSPKEQEMDIRYLLRNKFMDPNRRYTLIVSIIFINEEQLGVLASEIEHRKLQYLTSINAQLSSALKMIHMLNMQSGIQKQLELSLQKIKESNQILETISKLDELTGVYNRRGFFEMSSVMVHNSKFRDRKAILIFADLDNLKIINDRMGHDEGDYALKSSAEILKDSMRSSDIVARIGGDEFAALAIAERSTKGEVIRERIKELTERFNEQSDRNYYIGISVGYSEFVCDADVDLEKYLDEADERLYVDKQKKRKEIMK